LQLLLTSPSWSILAAKTPLGLALVGLISNAEERDQNTYYSLVTLRKRFAA
jgi:hypothetical protein